MPARIILCLRANNGLMFVLWIIATPWEVSHPVVYNTNWNDPEFIICTLFVRSVHWYNPCHMFICLESGWMSNSNCVFSLHLFAGLVDALRCVQWVLWLTCLSVLDCCALDSVGQETPSTERHEHSHPSRGGHGQHLVPGHGCRLRVSVSLSLSLSVLFILTHHYLLFHFVLFLVASAEGSASVVWFSFHHPLPFSHLSVTFSSETCSFSRTELI